jgi:hypothetical protein
MAGRDDNTKNKESALFKRLTRLFSGPIVNYRQQIPRREPRIQMDKHKFTSASGQQFKKTTYDPFANITSSLLAGQNRIDRYSDFNQMEYEPIIASSLDIYADEMTTSSELQPLLSIRCPNEEIKMILNTLFKSVINLEANLFGWSRSMCKFGDFFLYLDIDDNEGITNVIGMPSGEIERMEGQDKTNPNYVQYQWNSGGLTFENWQIAHFRILGNDKYTPYGTSVLEASRRIWRQLVLLEDAVMAYRIVRSPERRVFYVDVGNIAPQDVEQYMQKVVTQMKRNQVVDSTTGRVDLRYNPTSIEEDYFIPSRAGVSTRIETLPGGNYTGDIEDVKYLKDKLFAALKVPQAYLFRGEGADEDKATLAQKDIRFARTIQRLQRAVVAELEKVGIVHLYTLGYRGEDLISFKLSLNNPSKIAQLQELETWRSKFDAASAATEGFFSKRWIAHHLFGMSEEEFLRNQREMFTDRKLEASLEIEGEVDLDTAAGGDLDAPFGDEDFDTDAEGELGFEEPTEEPEAEEESPLLAAPGKRDDKPKPAKPGKEYTKKNWNGAKYKRKGHDDRRSAGGRLQGMKAKSASNYGKNNSYVRNPGYSELKSLANLTYEELDTTYKEEQKLFEVSREVHKLINELETKKVEVKTEA